MYVLLERNEDYYGEKARAHRIMVRSIPNPDVRFAALKAEEIMGVLDLNAYLLLHKSKNVLKE